MKRNLRSRIAAAFRSTLQRSWKNPFGAEIPRAKTRRIEPLEARIAPAIYYVGTPSSYTDPAHPGSPITGDSVTWNAGSGSHLSPSSVGSLTIGTNAFLTISAAVSAASNGDTIEVSTGVFTDNITINKSLTLLGANSGFAGSDSLDRTAETIIEPITNQNSIFAIASSGITIDGFTIDGDNPSVTGGPLQSGHDANANYGLVATSGYSNLTIENDIVQHVAIGFRGSGAGSGNVITNNWFNDLGVFDFGYAVSLQNNFYSDVTNNLMTQVWTGIQTSNFYAAGPATWNFTGNTIQSYAGGIWANLIYQAATPLTIAHNQISATTGAVTGNMGLLVTTIQDAAVVSITNNQISGTDYGVLAWNIPTSSTITLDSTNTISSTHIAGVDFTDNLSGTAIGTTVFGAATASKLALNGLGIGAAAGAGVVVDGSGTNAATLSLSGSIGISGGVTGLELTGASAGITGNSLGSLTFTGESGQYILLANGALHGITLDATGVTFDGHTGATATLAQNLAIEDKITHAVDDSTLGLVRVEAGNLFVTTNSFNTPDTSSASIQRAINFASSGDTINVAAGTYLDNITINQPLTLLGANSAFAGSDNIHRTAETIIEPITNQTSIIGVASNGVTVSGFTIDGDNPAVTGGALASGHDSNASYALRATSGYSNLTIENDIIQHVAIGFRGTGAGSSNLITNNLFNDLGVYDFGYAVSLQNNFYADVTNNVMTKVWTGIQTSNFYAAGPATWTFSGNTIQSYAAGIWANLIYQAATPLTIDHNQISATAGAAAGNMGLLITTVQDAAVVNVTNNQISGTDYGVLAWYIPTTSTITVDSTNSISSTHIAGVELTNNLSGTAIGTTVFGAAAAASKLALSALSIGATAGAGIIDDGSGTNGATLALSGAIGISGGATGLELIGAQSGITGNSLGSLTFTGQSGQYILLASGALHGVTLDATSVTFDGHTGATATLAQNFAIEDKITDAVDDPTLGFVRFDAGNIFVTANSFNAPDTTSPSIQRAINLASPGDTINVGAGSYPEAVNIDLTATVSLAGNVTIHSLTGVNTSEVLLNGNTLTDGDSTSTTYPGLIAGLGGSLIKVGSGTLTLPGANTYTGTTTINAGAILAENSASLGGSSAATVASGASLQLEGGITLSESLNLNGAGLGGSTGAVESISGSNTLSGPITLTGNTTLLVDPSSTLTLSGTIDGPFNLTVSIGAGGLADITGGIGTHTAPTSFTVTGAGMLELGGSLSVVGPTTFGTPLILTADTTLFSVGALAFDGDATIDSDGHGPWSLTLTTFNGLLLAAAVGQIAPLNNVTLSGLTVTADSPVDAASITVPSGATAATFFGLLDLTGAGTNFAVTATTLNVNGGVNSNGGSIDWNTDNLSLGANVSGSGSITIEPITASRSIGINGVGLLSLTTAEINDIQPGFTSLQIGSPSGSGAVAIGAVSFNEPVTILSPLGSMTVAGEISATGANSVTLHAAVVTLQVAEPTPAISTQAGDINIQGGVLLAANTKLLTTGGDVNQQGTVNGAFDLNVNAGAGTVNINGSSSPVNASIGGATRLASVEMSGGALNLQPLIYTTGSQTYTGGTIDIHAGGMSSSVSGNITFNGPVLLRTDIGVITTNGDAVFSSTVDNDSAFVGSHGALTIITPNSHVDFDGNVGDISALSGLTVTTAARVTFDGGLDVAGTTSLTANEVDFFGGANSVVGAILTLQPASAFIPIHLGATSTGTFNLTAADLAALAPGFQAINIGSAAGTAGFFVDPSGATFDDPITFRESLKGAITVLGPLTGAAGASFTFAGPAMLENDITTHGGSVSFGQAALGADVTISTNNGVLRFSNLISDSGGGHDLDLQTGFGSVSLSGGAGKTTGPQLGDVTIDSAGITTLAGSIYASSLTVGGGGLVELGGIIKTIGSQNYNEQVILTNNLSLTTHNADIDFTGDLVGSLTAKSFALTAKPGTGDITFGTVGDPTTLGEFVPLAAVNLTTKGDVTLSGDVIATTCTISAAHFTVQDVTTTGKQTYTGLGTFDGGLSGTALTITSKGNVSSTAAWDFSQTTKIKGSAIDLTSDSNLFGPLLLSGASADVHESGRIVLGAVTLTGNLDLTAGGDITQVSGSIHAGGFSADTTGAVLLTTVANVIKTIDSLGVNAGTAITILTGGAGLGIFGDLTAADGNIYLSADSGSSRGEITNHAGAGAFSVSTGFVYDVYSYSELATHLNGLTGFTNVVSGHRYPIGAPSLGNEVIYVTR